MFEIEANTSGFECRLIFGDNIWYYCEFEPTGTEKIYFFITRNLKVGLTKIIITFFKLNQLT